MSSQVRLTVTTIPLLHNNPRQVVQTHTHTHTPVPLSPCCITWYQSKDSDALQLLSKIRHGAFWASQLQLTGAGGSVHDALHI